MVNSDFKWLQLFEIYLSHLFAFLNSPPVAVFVSHQVCGLTLMLRAMESTQSGTPWTARPGADVDVPGSLGTSWKSHGASVIFSLKGHTLSMSCHGVYCQSSILLWSAILWSFEILSEDVWNQSNWWLISWLFVSFHGKFEGVALGRNLSLPKTRGVCTSGDKRSRSWGPRSHRPEK